MEKDIVLIGGGGHCKSVIDVIEKTELYKIIGIIDTTEKLGEKVLDYEIKWTDNDLPGLVKNKNLHFFITIGQIKDYSKRLSIYLKLKSLNIKLPTIISPLSYVSKYSKIGEGTIIMHHCIINSNVIIGNNCIINTKALIEHDAIIMDNCHISTGAIINGGVKVEANTFFGSSAVAKEYSVIPENSFIKANSLYYNKKNEKK